MAIVGYVQGAAVADAAGLTVEQYTRGTSACLTVVQQLIEDVWRSRGFTAMLVTHDVAEAVSLADRVILIEGGRVALDERVHLPRPRTRGSARFAALEERILGRVLQRPTERKDW